VICKTSEPLFNQIVAVQTSIQVVQFVVQNLQHCNFIDIGCHLVNGGMSDDEALAQIARWRQDTPDGWKRSPETDAQRNIISHVYFKILPGEHW
jgi:hypothetical protein